MREFLLERSQRVEPPLAEVFAFFGDPANLERLTPPSLGFRVVGCSTECIEEGSEIDYELRLHGIPIRWRSLISVWEPTRRFVDEQLRGPYRRWHHTHTFEEVEGGVLVKDRVRYAVWGGALVDKLFVRRQLESIFDYRTQALDQVFADETCGGAEEALLANRRSSD